MFWSASASSCCRHEIKIMLRLLTRTRLPLPLISHSFSPHYHWFTFPSLLIKRSTSIRWTAKKIVSRDSTHSFNYKKSQHKSRSLSEGIKSPQDLIKTKSRLYWATHYLLTHTEGWNGRMSLSLPSNRNYSTHKIATGPQIKCWIWTEEVMVMGSGFTPDLGSGAVFMASMILRFLATYVVDGEHGFLWSSTSAHCVSSKSILRK